MVTDSFAPDKTIAKTLKNEHEADKIAIATLNNGIIESIKYVTTAKELKAELQ